MSVVVGDWLYVIGGRSSVGVVGTVERAKIAADGTIGSFLRMSETDLAHPRMGAAWFIYDNYLYVTGGTQGPDFTAVNLVERARIEADGRLGPFKDTGFVLDTPRGYHNAFIIGRNLIIAGGMGNSAGIVRDSVPRAALNSGGGEPGPLGDATTITNGRLDSAPLVLPERIMLLAGRTNSLAYAASSVHSDIAADAPTTWVAGGNSPTRIGTSLVSIGDSLFAIGGRKDATLSNLAHATVTSVDTITEFVEEADTALTQPRHGHSTVVLGNHVYVIGGLVDLTVLGTVEVATIR
jgi:hypothetical protein